MKIKGKLTINCENAGEILDIVIRSLSPDNVSGMRTEAGKDSATVTFLADKIGTMLSSVDDYLMNAKIACDMVEKIGNNDGP